jgi:methyl-accepting chemotaxis protein
MFEFTPIELVVFALFVLMFAYVVITDWMHTKKHERLETWKELAGHALDTRMTECEELRAMIDTDRSRIQAIADDYTRIRDLSNEGISPEIRHSIDMMRTAINKVHLEVTELSDDFEVNNDAVHSRIKAVEEELTACVVAVDGLIQQAKAVEERAEQTDHALDLIADLEHGIKAVADRIKAVEEYVEQNREMILTVQERAEHWAEVK